MFKRLIIVAFIGAVGLTACKDDKEDNGEQSAQNTPAPTGVIVLADVSDNPERVIERMQPLADYLAANLHDQGIGIGEVRVAPDFDTMSAWLQAGEVDVYFDSLYPALIIRNATGAQPFLRRWRDGVSEYHSVFFVLTEAGYAALDDLQGHLVALDEPASTTGYMVPLAHLIQNDLTPIEVPDTETSVAADQVGYVFSGDDDNTIQWVVSGRVAAGVVDNVTYSEIPEETRSQLMILSETQDIPRQVAIGAPDLSAEMLAALTQVLTTMQDNEDGQAALLAFQDSQFDQFPDGIETALTEMQVLYDLVQEAQ